MSLAVKIPVWALMELTTLTETKIKRQVCHYFTIKKENYNSETDDL